MLFSAACEDKYPTAHTATPHCHPKQNPRNRCCASSTITKTAREGLRTVEMEELQSFEFLDDYQHLPQHAVAHTMTAKVQKDDVVLGRSLQPAHELPQLILRQLPVALRSIITYLPVRPGVAFRPQMQLTRELLTGVKGKSHLVGEGERKGHLFLLYNGRGRGGCRQKLQKACVLRAADAQTAADVAMSTPSPSTATAKPPTSLL